MNSYGRIRQWGAGGDGAAAILLCLLFLVLMVPTEVGAVAGRGDSVLPASRNLQFFHINRREGLSQVSVNNVAQDAQGYIWIGTQEGLNRYDGYELVVFENDPSDPGSLSHDWVWSVYVDREGVLWAGTDGGGLNRYDSHKQSFVSYRHDDSDPHSLASDRVRVILQDGRGDYWIGTDGGGLDRFDRATGRFVHYRHDGKDPVSLPGNKVMALHEDSRGTIWVGTNGGLARLDDTRTHFRVYRNDPSDDTTISNDDVRAIHEDRQGRFWVGTFKGGLNLLDRDTGRFQHFRHRAEEPGSLSHNWVRSIYQDRRGTLWVGTDDGLNQLVPETGTFIHYVHDPLNPASLSNNQISTVYEDEGNVLWVGTFNGLNKWNYVSDAFNYLFTGGDKDAAALDTTIITSLAEGADGSLWIGRYGSGLSRVERDTGVVEYFRHDKNDPHSLSDDRVMSLFADNDGTVWVGTRNGGLNHLDPASGKVERYLHDPADSHSLSSNAITTIFRDRQGILWVGTYGAGLNRQDPRTGGFRVYRHDPADDRSLGSDRVLAIFQDRSNVLWIGTEDGGLNRFDPISHSFLHYRHDPETPSSLSSDAAWHVMEGRDGSLWISTMGGGVNRWAPADRRMGRPRFRKYLKSDGLRSNTIYAALEDREGHLWLSSNRGIARLDPNTGEIRHYDRFNGLRGDEFNAGAYLKTRSGELYFGSAEGVLGFNPDVLATNMHPPEIVLTVHTRERNLATVSTGGGSGVPPSLRFSHDEDYVAFDFVALDFTSPHMNNYRYVLEGFDREWIETRKVRSAVYTSLPAGDYTFRVKASNNDGIWNETGISLPIHVNPPPWRSPWAFMLYALLIGGILFGYKKSQDRRHQRALEYSAEMEKLVDARTRELNQRNQELKKLNDKLQKASVTDSLTGLKNRRYLYESIGSRVATINRRAEDTQKEKTSSKPIDIMPSLFFMMIDLDGFKAVNDTYGHAAGDQVLLQVRDILQASCRESDIVVRWGGDEFLIMGENNNVHAPERLAERLRHNLAEHRYSVSDGHSVRLSGSIGFSMYPFYRQGRADLLSWEQVVAMADHAAYTAKKNGRNAWVGIHGTRKSSWSDFAAADIDIVELAARGMLSVRTSLESLEAVAKKGHREKPNRGAAT